MLAIRIPYREALAERNFTISYELKNFKGRNIDNYIKSIVTSLENKVDVFTVPQNPTARIRMDSFVYMAKVLELKPNVDVMPHLTCRDGTCIDIQSKLATGYFIQKINNVFVVTGDPFVSGDYPELTTVHDLKVTELIEIIKNDMNAQGTYHSGKVRFEDGPTDYFVGAALLPLRKEEINYAKEKIDLGVDFFITQITYDLDDFRKFIYDAEKQGIEINRPIILGTLPFGNIRFLDFLTKKETYKNYYINMPEKVSRRLSLNPTKIRENVKQLCLEIYDNTRSEFSRYIKGAHIMPIGNDSLGIEIVEELK